MKQPAVSGHAAAAGADRHHHLVGQRRPAVLQLVLHAHVAGRACGMHGHRPHALRARSGGAAGDRAPRRWSRAPRPCRSAPGRPRRARGATSWARPWAHELASITTGRRPPSLQRSSASRGVAGHVLLAARGSPSSSTAWRSSDRPRRAGSRAAVPPGGTPPRGPRAGWARPLRRGVAEDPVHAGRQVHGRRSCRHGARQAGGRRGRHRVRVGGHEVVAHRAAEDLGGPAHGPRSRPPRAPRPRRAALRGPPAPPTRSAWPPPGPPAPPGRCARAERKAFISLPVSIATGQAIRQVPSAAQVSMASCSYSRSSTSSTGEPSGWRAISRRRTIRWRGVVVDVTAGADGLAEAALHALRHHLLDRRRRLQVLACARPGRGSAPLPGSARRPGRPAA